MQQEGHQPQDVVVEDPIFELSLVDLESGQNYCDECRRLVRSWPWAEIIHQAPSAMKDLKCPLCNYIWRTLILEKRIPSWEQNKLATLHSFANENDPHKDVAILREPITDISIDSSINGMRRMIEDCARNHGSCREQFGDFLANPAELPKRVLQINRGRGDIRVYEPAPEEKAAYATLSYTWGPDFPPSEKQLVTAKILSSLDENEWVANDCLPQCFQDAVELTRRLNLEYLWIDCICIRGDDIEERSREISDFVHIFRNSTVCIRPANIDSVHQSFLRKECPYSTGPACTVRVKDRRNQETVLKFTTKENDATSGMERFDGPLRLGSWNLAERFVSPRQLTITTHNEATFYCLHPYHSARYPYFWAETLNESFTKHHYTSTVGLEWVVMYDSYAPNVTATWEQWWKMVTDIHLGAIERPEDRALMIDCIARHPIWGTEYLHGLWKHRLRELLAWKNDGGRITSPALRQQNPLGVRLPKVPTWSWASTSGTVSYHDLTYLGNWQFTAKNWVSGAPVPYAKDDHTVASKVYIYGKCVSVKTYRKKLAKTAPNYFSQDYGEEMRTLNLFKSDDLCLLLMGQMDFGTRGNIHAAPSKGSSATDEYEGTKSILNSAKATFNKLAALTISEDQTSSADGTTEAQTSPQQNLQGENLGSASQITSGSTQTEPTREEPTREEPTREEPTREEPTRDEPTRNEPTRGEPRREEPIRGEPTTVATEPRAKRRSFFDWIGTRSTDASGSQKSYRFPRPSSRITKAFSNKKPEQLGSFAAEKPFTKISEPLTTSTNAGRISQDSLQNEDEPVELGWRRSFEGNADSYPEEFMSSQPTSNYTTSPQEEIFTGRCTVAARRPKVSIEEEKDDEPELLTSSKLDPWDLPEKKKKKKKYIEPIGVSWGKWPDSGQPEEMEELVLDKDNKLMVLRRIDENHYERLGIADQGPCTKQLRSFWGSVPKSSFCIV